METSDNRSATNEREKMPPGFKLINTLRGYYNTIRQIAWSPDKQFLAAVTVNNLIRVWDREGNTFCEESFRQYGEAIWLGWWHGSQILIILQEKFLRYDLEWKLNSIYELVGLRIKESPFIDLDKLDKIAITQEKILAVDKGRGVALISANTLAFVTLISANTLTFVGTHIDNLGFDSVKHTRYQPDGKEELRAAIWLPDPEGYSVTGYLAVATNRGNVFRERVYYDDYSIDKQSPVLFTGAAIADAEILRLVCAGKQLIAAILGELIVIDIDEEAVCQRLAAHDAIIIDLIYEPQTKLLLAKYLDGTHLLWAMEVVKGEESKSEWVLVGKWQKSPAFGYYSGGVSFGSSDGQTVTLAMRAKQDTIIEIWEIDREQLVSAALQFNTTLQPSANSTVDNEPALKPALNNDLSQQRPATYLHSLTLENVRCFKQTTLSCCSNDQPAKWTILLGNNGIGKTTLLQAIVAAMPVVDSPLRDPKNDTMVGLVNYAWRPIRKGEKRSNIQLKFFQAVALDIHAENPTLPEPCQAEVIINANDTPGEIRFKTKGTIVYAYGASRRMATNGSQNPDYLVSAGGKTTASLFFDNISLINAEEWILRLDYMVKSPGLIPGGQTNITRDNVNEILNILKKLLPDIQDIQPRVKNPDGQNPSEFGPIVLYFQTPFGWVTIEELSLGYRTLIAWVIDLASQLFNTYPDSPHPLAEPAIVLVDEIDLHLHPQWQRQVITNLDRIFPRTQFIATAHSPLIVQAAAEVAANIVVLQLAGEQVVLEVARESFKNWRADQILTSELFGLSSARSIETEKLLNRRWEILAKLDITPEEKAELQVIEATVDSLPTEDTATYIRAMELMKKITDGYQGL